MAATRKAPRLSDARIREIAVALEAVRAACDLEQRLASDPIHFVHTYRDPLDREIVALLASSLAFGNVKAFSAKIRVVLDVLGPRPAEAASDKAALLGALRTFRHRFCTGADVACLLAGGRALQRAEGSLGAALAARLGATAGDWAGAVAAWSQAVRAAGGLDRRRTHGARHILPRPELGSANKRLMLMLRWMIRPADGVDLGQWPLDPAKLVMPVDVHVHKLARNIGMTNRKAADYRTALDATSALARIDPADPTKYDFALCHLGMVQRCPSRRDPVRCEGCGVRPICRHWARARS